MFKTWFQEMDPRVLDTQIVVPWFSEMPKHTQKSGQCFSWVYNFNSVSLWICVMIKSLYNRYR